MDRFSSYKARMAASVARGLVLPPSPPPFIGPTKPRDDYPVNARALAERYSELGSQQLRWAVANFKMAEQVRQFCETAP